MFSRFFLQIPIKLEILELIKYSYRRDSSADGCLIKLHDLISAAPPSRYGTEIITNVFRSTGAGTVIEQTLVGRRDRWIMVVSACLTLENAMFCVRRCPFITKITQLAQWKRLFGLVIITMNTWVATCGTCCLIRYVEWTLHVPSWHKMNEIEG